MQEVMRNEKEGRRKEQVPIRNGGGVGRRRGKVYSLERPYIV